MEKNWLPKSTLLGGTEFRMTKNALAENTEPVASLEALTLHKPPQREHQIFSEQVAPRRESSETTHCTEHQFLPSGSGATEQNAGGWGTKPRI